MSGVFRYSEELLAQHLGQSREQLKSIRDQRLQRGRDWDKNGAGVLLSNSGLRVLWREIGAHPTTFDLRECLSAAPRKKNGAETNVGAIALGSATMPIPVEMRITRIPSNPQVVLCHDAHNRLQSVWVGRNALFVTGTLLKVVPHPAMPGFWMVKGPLPPRKMMPDEYRRWRDSRL